jgi:hypothetical protein
MEALQSSQLVALASVLGEVSSLSDVVSTDRVSLP